MKKILLITDELFQQIEARARREGVTVHQIAARLLMDALAKKKTPPAAVWPPARETRTR